MCRRELLLHAACGHQLERTRRCWPHSQYSPIIPKKCVDDFKLADPEHPITVKQPCFACLPEYRKAASAAASMHNNDSESGSNSANTTETSIKTSIDRTGDADPVKPAPGTISISIDPQPNAPAGRTDAPPINVVLDGAAARQLEGAGNVSITVQNQDTAQASKEKSASGSTKDEKPQSTGKQPAITIQVGKGGHDESSKESLSIKPDNKSSSKDQSRNGKKR